MVAIRTKLSLIVLDADGLATFVMQKLAGFWFVCLSVCLYVCMSVRARKTIAPIDLMFLRKWLGPPRI